MNRALHPSIADTLSESLAPRNVGSWIHRSDQIKHSFDGATIAEMHAHTCTLCTQQTQQSSV